MESQLFKPVPGYFAASVGSKRLSHMSSKKFRNITEEAKVLLPLKKFGGIYRSAQKNASQVLTNSHME